MTSGPSLADTPSTRPNTRFYGRKGRPLSQSLRRQLETYGPKLKLVEFTPITKLDSLFRVPVSSYGLEIGFGDGESLAAKLRDIPDMAWIGVDPYRPGQAKLLHRADQDKTLSRLRLSRHSLSIIPYLPSGSFQRIDVLFPDPWPKRRHWGRRVIQTESLTHFLRLLAPGGSLLIATDDDAYAAWIATKIAPLWSWDPAQWSTKPEDWITTSYQRKAMARGRQTVYFCLRQIPSSP